MASTTLATSSVTSYDDAQYFSKNYRACRYEFIRYSEDHPQLIFHDVLKFADTQHQDPGLFIDITGVGCPTAENILFHFSGTHGVEGFAGSAIQLKFLKEKSIVPANTAVYFIHAVNAFGMDQIRRTTERNVDLNRNCTDQRDSDPLYAKIDYLINPKKRRYVDFFHVRALFNIALYGSSEILQALAGGQYAFPEGLFYGGNELEEAPKLLMEWIEKKFSSYPSKNLRFGLLDVHTGLGQEAEETLISPVKHPMLAGTQIEKKIEDYKVSQTVPYSANGFLIVALAETIKKTTKCADEHIFYLAQEFGTVKKREVFLSLRDENTAYNEAKRNGQVLPVTAPEKQRLLAAFNPPVPRWRHLVVQQGMGLIAQVLDVFPH